MTSRDPQPPGAPAPSRARVAADHSALARSEPYPKPAFSLAERDRRWTRVRALMRRDGIDGIVAFNTTSSHDRSCADVRYLTQIGDNNEELALCFPLDGEVRVFTKWGGRWPADNWLGEIRAHPNFKPWSNSVLEAIREAGLEHGTIAICGLEPGVLSAVRSHDGYAPYLAVQRLKEALPHARFVGAAGILGEARYVKSAEEIAFLRRGVSMAERSLHALLEVAAVGVFEPRLMAAMYHAAIAAGGSLPLMLGWYSGPFGHPHIVRLEQPSHRMVESGDGVMVEIEGRWGGYVGQIDESVTFGAVPPWAEDAHKAAVECWHDVFAAIRPGVRFEELRQAARKIERSGTASGALIMHGRGLGDDGPLILPFAGSETRAEQDLLVEDTVFIVKPNVTYRGHQNVGHVGETVLVTRGGAERLGTRPIEHYWHVD